MIEERMRLKKTLLFLEHRKFHRERERDGIVIVFDLALVKTWSEAAGFRFFFFFFNRVSLPERKEAWRFINGEQWENQRWGKQKLKFYWSFLKWIHKPHSLFIHYIDHNYSRKFVIMGQEEDLWMLKSQVNWMIQEDQNTTFYHVSTLVRTKRNQILAIKNSVREWI